MNNRIYKVTSQIQLSNLLSNIYVPKGLKESSQIQFSNLLQNILVFDATTNHKLYVHLKLMYKIQTSFKQFLPNMIIVPTRLQGI